MNAKFHWHYISGLEFTFRSTLFAFFSLLFHKSSSIVDPKYPNFRICVA